jgi:hypothetical protein
MTARKFFYLCAGVFLLALSYHLGASTSDAQGAGLGLVCRLAGTDMYSTESFCTPGGDVYQYWGGRWTKTSNVFGGAPGGRQVVSYDSGVALASTGEVFVSSLLGYNGWTSRGFPVGGPTPALQESWGQLKSRYAPKSAPTSQPPTDR